MGFYRRHVLPRLIDRACSSRLVEPKRREIVPLAVGRVLELGAGSGLNLALYDPARVERVIALEPEPALRRLAAGRLAAAPVPVEWVEAPAEAVPLPAARVDTVLVTWTLCTVPDLPAALAEARRVLRPGGALLFCEHGAAPDPGVRRWQDRLDGLWRRCAGGCHLNRAPDRALAAAGFALERLETGYLPDAPRFAGFTYLGVARAP